jgi:hypothetical protein
MTLQSVLEFLDGKKATIGTGLLALNAILIAMGAYSAEVGAALATLVFVLTGIGVAATNSVLGSRTRSKE